MTDSRDKSFLNQYPSPADGYSVDELDGELLLFNLSSDKILHVNQTGALVWSLCNGKRTAADIIELLRTAYQESASEIEGDVLDILSAFAKEEAIVWKE